MDIEALCNCQSLAKLNELLTLSMTERSIQSLIKGDGLDRVIERVIELKEDKEELFAAAILSRLAAVARGRERQVFANADRVFTSEPPSIETLKDSDYKQYAAQMLAYASLPWVPQFSYRDAVRIESADNARRILLSANLHRQGTVAAWLSAVTPHADVLKEIGNWETRMKRVRRICCVMRDVVEHWRGDVGGQVGGELSRFLRAFLPSTQSLEGVDVKDLYEAVDCLVEILGRIIELRFSLALQSETYALIPQARTRLGPKLWLRFIEQSEAIGQLRIDLLEAALVLARQNRTDHDLVAILIAAHGSRTQAKTAIKRHFSSAKDVDPDIAYWWLSAGSTSRTTKTAKHNMGRNEDCQIGVLLIEVESNQEAMDKVGRAVVPLLDISEPVLASTVKKAVDGYQQIAQIVRRLARMRRLRKTELKGERLEYNPLEQEMLGGHRPGVRRVKVVRDGIQKDFNGKIKTLVKPWVVPEE